MFSENTYYFGIKIVNNLSTSLKNLMNEKAKFKIAPKQYLNIHSFHPIDKFLLPEMESVS
jgi:hypothetical protein